MVTTEAMPATSDAQAAPFRRAPTLLLGVRASDGRGRNAAADHTGDCDQREHIREGVEEKRRCAALLEVGGQPVSERAREPEEKAGGKRTERPPVAEDQRRDGDEATARSEERRVGKEA